MFYLNVGHAWSIVEDVAADAVILPALRSSSVAILRRDPDKLPATVLFDPQAYVLSYEIRDDEVEAYEGMLLKMAMYPWFGMISQSFDSSEQSQAEHKKEIKAQLPALWAARSDPSRNWQSVVRSCLDFQRQFGVSTPILPAFAIRDPEDDLGSYFDALDDALEVLEPADGSPFVTIALDRSALAHRSPADNDLIAALADGLTARRGVERVYVVVTAETSSHVRLTNPRVVGSFLRLVRLLSGSLEVVVNFVECLGLAALGVGASGYGCGYFTKGRTFRLTDFRVRGGGAAYPKFHSPRLALDFAPQDDLDERLARNGLLWYVDEDETPFSTDLLEVLRAGGQTQYVDLWRESMSNTSAAQRHFAVAHATLAAEAVGWDTRRTRRWIQQAEASWVYLADRFERDPFSVADGVHLRPWRDAIERVTS